MNNLELQKLADRLETLERRTQALEDRCEIENLMSRYQYYYTARMNKEILEEIWAKGNIGITMEDRFFGVYENFDGAFPDAGLIMYYDTAMNAGSPKDYPGRMSVFTTTTQMIEVAGDGKTAKGIWLSIGTETDAGDLGYDDVGKDPAKVSGVTLDMTTEDGKRYKADWVWQKYGVDFIKEDGHWKLWHFHIYDIFRCPFDQDWVTFSEERRIELDTKLASERSFSAYGKPPGQGTSFHWQYSPRSLPPLEPKPPKPYTHFEETFRY